MARFFRRGRSKVSFLTTIAAPTTGPTTAELSAGVDLTGAIATVNGFDISNSPISVPDLSSGFTSTIVGEDTTAASSFVFYDDDTTTSLRTALSKGSTGYIVLLPYGQVTGKRAEVWPVRSTGVNDSWTTGNEAAQFTVGFAVTSTPSQNAVSP